MYVWHTKTWTHSLVLHVLAFSKIQWPSAQTYLYHVALAEWRQTALAWSENIVLQSCLTPEFSKTYMWYLNRASSTALPSQPVSDCWIDRPPLTIAWHPDLQLQHGKDTKYRGCAVYLTNAHDQAPSLAKMHRRRWSLGMRLPSLHVITKTLCIWWLIQCAFASLLLDIRETGPLDPLRTPQSGFIKMCIWWE